jgi:hypothetical protein
MNGIAENMQSWSASDRVMVTSDEKTAVIDGCRARLTAQIRNETLRPYCIFTDRYHPVAI